MSKLIFSKENGTIWHYVYSHGELEQDTGTDLVLFSEEMPTEEGYYIAYFQSRAILVHLVADENGIMKGRACYVDDYNALVYINRPWDWC